jgi:hypothetical protein
MVEQQVRFNFIKSIFEEKKLFNLLFVYNLEIIFQRTRKIKSIQ